MAIHHTLKGALIEDLPKATFQKPIRNNFSLCKKFRISFLIIFSQIHELAQSLTPDQDFCLIGNQVKMLFTKNFIIPVPAPAG